MPDPVSGVPRSTVHTLEQEPKQVTVLQCSLAHATTLATHLRREASLPQTHAEAALTIATDHGFPQQWRRVQSQVL